MFVNYKIVRWLANGKKFDVDKIIVLPMSETDVNSSVVILITTREMREIRATIVAKCMTFKVCTDRPQKKQPDSYSGCSTP
jgi:hypothetical protein